MTQTRENCDVLIAMMHWGSEFTYDISTQQEEVSQLLSDLGVDIIIGNHSHCSQPMEWINNNRTLCMYSLGNFVSADPIVDRTHQEFKNAYNVSMMVSLDIVEENNQISIQNIDYIPVINYYDEDIFIFNRKFEFNFIASFIIFLNYDLSHANLIYCDNLDKIPHNVKLNLTDAKMQSKYLDILECIIKQYKNKN